MSTHTGRREEEAGGVGGAGRGYSNRRAPGDQWFPGCRCRCAALGRPCVRKSFENSLRSPQQKGLPREIMGAHLGGSEPKGQMLF